ncbi:NPP1 family protein [Streptomyces lincolnensis]|uniref:NPP1 family protein n=1 Tax=Streptomyces TaxID=1883 RepID=UPI001E49414B|nr:MULTISPECIES: NPP1 family protein [Streptomyces]MCD7443216.1 NPP1 family protein [Streptomyces lincolnensis]WLW50785.1 NPP1 family protein [Streptomyces coralus]
MSHAPKKSPKSLKSRLGRLGKAALVAGSATALTFAMSNSAHAAVLNPLNESTTTFQKNFQPVFDYDGNSCFPATAIDSSGTFNGGLDDSGSVTGQCRTGHLGKAQTYSRVKCNNGWCGIVYSLYFEKDMSCGDCTPTSHRHDWESAVIWVRQGASTPEYASVSAHGEYTTSSWSSVQKDGVRLKVVYHKGGNVWDTHSFRFAKSGEVAEAWGDGGWDFPRLVSWNSYPGGSNTWTANLQTLMQSKTWGDANFPLKDGRFNTELSRAKPSGISFDPNA